MNSITSNTQAVIDNQVTTISYVDRFHQENERSRRNLGIDFFDESNVLVKRNQDKNFTDNKLTNLDRTTVNRTPTSDNELANKKYGDDSLGGGNILRFNQTQDNYLKVSVANDVFFPTKLDKIQISDKMIMKYTNICLYLLQRCYIS